MPLAIIGGLCCLFYIVMLPSFWAWVLIKGGRRGRRIEDKQFIARYGWVAICAACDALTLL